MVHFNTPIMPRFVMLQLSDTGYNLTVCHVKGKTYLKYSAEKPFAVCRMNNYKEAPHFTVAVA
jgi:hypothetical protein